MACIVLPPVFHLVTAQSVEGRILEIRGHRVILDRDLAEVYGEPTKRLNQQVNRNPKRFPPDLAFRLTKEETAEVVANCNHLSKLKYSRTLPMAFTEYGALMAANVLRTERAIEMSLFVIRAFVRMRDMLAGRGEIARRLDSIERKLLRHDHALQVIYKEIKALRGIARSSERPRIGIRNEADPK
jgi:hypothetical protein